MILDFFIFDFWERNGTQEKIGKLSNEYSNERTLYTENEANVENEAGKFNYVEHT
jgi:hypothetical protein